MASMAKISNSKLGISIQPLINDESEQEVDVVSLEEEEEPLDLSPSLSERLCSEYK